MENNMDDKLAKIAQKKQQLLQIEKLLKNKEREKEKKRKLKESLNISELAIKANIDKIDKDILLGAFLEISERATQSEFAENWKKAANEFQKKYSATATPLSISFESSISDDAKICLKNLKFKWNKFRREFYGYGNKNQIETLLQGFGCQVEQVE